MPRPSKQLKATFYLPLHDNDGRDLETEIDEVLDRCFREFNAWTFVGFIEGAWRMESGDRRVDESAVYSIVLDESHLLALKEILLGFKSRTNQEAIYLEVQRHVELVLL